MKVLTGMEPRKVTAAVIHFLILLFCSLFVARAQTENETQPVYFSLIFSGGENGYNSSLAIPAIDIALEQIELNQLLPGYKLTYVTAQNSKVLVSKKNKKMKASSTVIAFIVSVYTYSLTGHVFQGYSDYHRN